MTEKSAKKEAPSAVECALVLALHGVFLATAGAYGAYTTGWVQMHSAYSGAGCGAILVLCAAATGSKVYLPYMIGVHLALMFQLLFVVVFGVQTFKSRERTDGRFALFAVMLAGSVAALGLMVAYKPKKPKSKAT